MNKIFTIVAAFLLAACLGACGWLVLNPVQPWPSFDGVDRSAEMHPGPT
jgi:uncharacterized lipoprotein YajG